MYKLLSKLFRKLITKHFNIALITLILFTITLYIFAGTWIFFYLPNDYLQGDLVKIMYIHVPCAWISLASYIILGIFSTFYLMYNDRMCNIGMQSAMIVSLNSCLITLVTGAIWGKAAWGTWWIWDPRLTAVFIQFCLLLICYMMKECSNNNYTIDQSVALLTIIGLINIPIIKFAVNTWNSIHQNASVFRMSGVRIASEFFYPLIISFIAICCFYLLIGLISARNQINEIKNS